MSIGAIPGLIGSGKRIAEPSSIPSGNSRANAVFENAARSQEAVREAMDLLRELIADRRTMLDISVDSQTGVYVIRVLDAQTGELIREVPPREVLNCISRILHYAGILFDRTA